MQKPWTGAFVAALLTAAVAMPAQAQQLQNKARFPNALLCAAPEGASGANGARITMVACNYDDLSHFWKTEYAGNANGRMQFWIRNRGTGKCLDLTDGRTADWTALQQWECVNSTTMKWAYNDLPITQGGPWFNFINLRSQKCLDVAWGSADEGAVVQNFRCLAWVDGQENRAQIWQWGPNRP